MVSCQSATNCHWGPSYWCQDEVIAEECGGTQYCRDKVWKVIREGKYAGTKYTSPLTLALALILALSSTGSDTGGAMGYGG